MNDRCGNCGVDFDDHEECPDEGCPVRVCADGIHEYRPETDEDRIALRAAAMGL